MVGPVTFQVCPFQNASYGLFSRRIHQVNPEEPGKAQSGEPGSSQTCSLASLLNVASKKKKGEKKCALNTSAKQYCIRIAPNYFGVFKGTRATVFQPLHSIRTQSASTEDEARSQVFCKHLDFKKDFFSCLKRGVLLLSEPVQASKYTTSIIFMYKNTYKHIYKFHYKVGEGTIDVLFLRLCCIVPVGNTADTSEQP